jgi:translation initiation factor IF-3
MDRPPSLVVGGPLAAFRVFRAATGPEEGDSISVEPRINDRIRAAQVRVVGADGEQLGVMDTVAAQRMANELDLDLVEVAPLARPPVTKLMDYSKYKYEQAIKAKEARRKQSLVVLKEMKMRPKIDPHDYETKKGHVERFLKQGHKVKVTIMFRGREMAHTELGRRLLERLATDITEIAQVDSPARQDGRNMIAVFSPRKTQGGGRTAPVADRGAAGRGTGQADRGGSQPARPTSARTTTPADQTGGRVAPVPAS